MKKAKPPIDMEAMEKLLARGRTAIGALIGDPKVDPSYKLFLMRKLEDVVVEAEETVEDVRDSAEERNEYRQTGGRDIEEVFSGIAQARAVPDKKRR